MHNWLRTTKDIPMDKLKMHTLNIADENFKKLSALFPNAVTETITGYDEKGKAIIERAI